MTDSKYGKNMIGSTFWRKTGLAAHSGKNQDYQHILGKNMIGGTFWENK
jgi:hypothetical protein